MKKKNFTIKFVLVGTHGQSIAIIKKILRVELTRYFSSEGVIPNNLDEVLDKYISMPVNERRPRHYQK